MALIVISCSLLTSRICTDDSLQARQISRHLGRDRSLSLTDVLSNFKDDPITQQLFWCHVLKVTVGCQLPQRRHELFQTFPTLLLARIKSEYFENDVFPGTAILIKFSKHFVELCFVLWFRPSECRLYPVRSVVELYDLAA